MLPYLLIPTLATLLFLMRREHSSHLRRMAKEQAARHAKGLPVDTQTY